MTTRTRTRRALTLATGLALAALTLGVLGYLLWRDRAVLLAYDWQIRWEPLLGALALFGVALWLAALVWADIMAALGSRVRASVHVRYYCLTQLTKRLPGTLWYIAGRGYLYGREGDSLGLVAVASGLELAVSVVAGALVSLGLLVSSALPAARGQWVALLILLAGGFALVQPGVVRWILAKAKVAYPADLRRARLLRWVAGYALVWLMGGVILFLAIRALMPLDGRELPYIIGSWSLVGVLSVTVFFLPSNLGFTEVGLSLLFARIMPAPFAIFAAVFVRVLLLLFEILGAAVVLVIQAIQARKHKTPARPISPTQ